MKVGMLVVAPLVLASVMTAAAATAAGAEPPRDANPALSDVLLRAGEYVVRYEKAFQNVLAEEEYVQRTQQAPTGAPNRRTTRAELVFVRLEGPIPWATFRDVFEADGKPVRERDGRLERLFLDHPESAVEKAETFLAESMRYNIGVVRTVNTPTLPLVFLHPANQARFEFRRRGRPAPGKPLEVSFREVARPTLVREYKAQTSTRLLQEGSDLPTEGRLWIDAEDGTVTRSEVRFLVSRGDAKATVTTTYRAEPSLAMWVPDEMKESYSFGDSGGTGSFAYGVSGCGGCFTEAVARYTRMRRFEVTTNEKARVPDP